MLQSCPWLLASLQQAALTLPTAADAKRWNGVRSVVQARALLKTLFRSASQPKAQASTPGWGSPA